MDSQPVEPYPVIYTVQYPEKGLSRVSTVFRLFLVIRFWLLTRVLLGTTTLPLVTAILFKKKYPRWWFDFNLERARFSARVSAYAALMTDEPPSIDEVQCVSLDFEYPDVRQLHRVLPLFKWLLALPHRVVLCFLRLVSFAVTVFAWFAIIITGKYPRSLFTFMVGVQRWSWRVSAYSSLLITDRYPPFSMR